MAEKEKQIIEYGSCSKGPFKAAVINECTQFGLRYLKSVRPLLHSINRGNEGKYRYYSSSLQADDLIELMKPVSW